MPQYILSGYIPENFDPSTVTEKTIEAIHALNREMDAAGVTKFACGLGAAHSVRKQLNGDIVITDGPFLEAKELVGGMSIVEVASLEDALEWARKGIAAHGMGVEVREVFFMPDPQA